ncbi:FAD-binding oxidoreductase [Bradyrhizobium manausense]|uniref:NAD(P)/FAD-dependent oxidoreductase n=1 Tax=Bradyrhizobium TaxID=374 RepID=UPI001BA5C972|nr:MULTISPECIES: FAD-dependent oxidoreductase [Bradyrhizobium]MBR0827339.1 FAD-binding oxidoreductase [Bradyrhizobium manausense]UVO27301.1 FAD-binding oxidoreductase [Bradyrhizobium arachidis]
MKANDVEILVIGAGIAGIATAYFLAVEQKRSRLLIVDEGQPMALTSAQSGENYRNWWPHPTMAAFTDHSTDLMEDIARRTDNRFNMTRRGYFLATRDEKPEELLQQLFAGYGASASRLIRMHEGSGKGYSPPTSADWQTAPDGVDVLLGRELIQKYYPMFDKEVATGLHIRRAGDISGQQLGQYMLETMRPLGVRFQQAKVLGIAKTDRFAVDIIDGGTRQTVKADIIVNAAGPFAAHVAAMHGEKLPILNVLQQKIAFADRNGAVDRRLPFSIDLDGQSLAWSDDEREALAAAPEFARLLEPMPGSIHCRPDGGDHGDWIKLGWAFNHEPSEPVREPELNPHFPEIVLRAASRLQPALRQYLGALPRDRVHYGGYYPMTKENWPLIGAARTPGVFLATALSGFGTMSACAAGDLCARAVVGAPAPSFANVLSLARYQDEALMDELRRSDSRGLL